MMEHPQAAQKAGDRPRKQRAGGFGSYNTATGTLEEEEKEQVTEV